MSVELLNLLTNFCTLATAVVGLYAVSRSVHKVAKSVNGELAEVKRLIAENSYREGVRDEAAREVKKEDKP